MRVPGSAVSLADPDLRTAAALLVGCAAVRAAIPGEPGLACPLRTLTGVPCPLCGMTTSVTAAIQLHPVEALAANPAGLLVLVLATGVLLGPARRLVVRSGLVYFALAAMWLWELHRFALL